MLTFTDLNLVKHAVNVNHVTNVAFDKKSGHKVTFWFMHNHCLPISVDQQTFERISQAVSVFGEYQDDSPLHNH